MNYKKQLEDIRNKKSLYWSKKEEVMKLDLFKRMAQRVPAYKKFLKKSGIKPDSIRTHYDLKNIPPITKDNYLRKYSLREKTWDGNLLQPAVLTATSGSTGRPVYFTRNNSLISQSALIHQLFFHNKGFSTKKPTLVIDAFGMGVWIGGLITYEAFHEIQQQGYPITVITPGINMSEILKIFQNIAHQYSQIILTGYPPFIKDVIDQLSLSKINYKHAKIRLLFAAEPFTDKFRSHISKCASLNNPLFDTCNIYGSADLGTMAFETPQSILIRQIACKKKSLFNAMFSEIEKTPTLAQYIPTHISFEQADSELLVSGNNSIPLFKYAIGDHGGVFTHTEIQDILTQNTLSTPDKTKLRHIQTHINELPFVYVYERMDFSTTLYGLIIYPEPIREVLLKHPFTKDCTGKFTMSTKFDNKHDQYLEINVELKQNVFYGKKEIRFLEKSIAEYLKHKSAEFKELSMHLGERALPIVIPWKNADPTFFAQGVKQRWVKK